MILEKETFEKYGYKFNSVPPKSNKFIIFKCDYCSKVFERPKCYLHYIYKFIKIDCCSDLKCKHKKRLKIENIKGSVTFPKIGDKFGYWTVFSSEIFRQGNIGKKPRIFVKCQCKCEKIEKISLYELKKGASKSCGCGKIKHQSTGTPLYLRWIGIRHRCKNTKTTGHKKYYAEKGIKVCKEWEESFENFKNWALSNNYKDGLTIDRIDPDKNYCPENCEWVTKSENSKRAAIGIKFKKQKLLQENQRLKDRVIYLEEELNYLNDLLKDENLSMVV